MKLKILTRRRNQPWPRVHKTEFALQLRRPLITELHVLRTSIHIDYGMAVRVRSAAGRPRDSGTGTQVHFSVPGKTVVGVCGANEQYYIACS